MNKLTSFYKYDKTGQQKIQDDQKSLANSKDIKAADSASVKNENPEESDHIAVDSDEQRLELFDADPDFGPCVGIGREKRWKNAERLGLSPPQDLIELIYSSGHGKSYLDKYIY